MVPTFNEIRRHRSNTQWFVVVLTVILLCLHEMVSAYQLSIMRAQSYWRILSTGEWVVFSIGSFIVEPVLLFVSLYYVNRRLEDRLPVGVLLPSLIVAVVVGSLLGQFVGWSIWNVPTPLYTALQRNLFYPSPLTVLHWEEFAEPLVRSLLTALAALGLTQYRSGR